MNPSAFVDAALTEYEGRLRELESTFKSAIKSSFPQSEFLVLVELIYLKSTGLCVHAYIEAENDEDARLLLSPDYQVIESNFNIEDWDDTTHLYENEQGVLACRSYTYAYGVG